MKILYNSSHNNNVVNGINDKVKSIRSNFGLRLGMHYHFGNLDQWEKFFRGNKFDLAIIHPGDRALYFQNGRVVGVNEHVKKYLDTGSKFVLESSMIWGGGMVIPGFVALTGPICEGNNLERLLRKTGYLLV